MGLLDLFRTKGKNNLKWVLNSSGEWIYPNDNADAYIKEGYKSLPNVYAIISLIIQKSSIVPFEVYRVKNQSKYSRYKALMNNKCYTQAIKVKNESLEKIDNSDLEKLLNKPNDYQGLEALWQEIDGYKLLTGNSYLYGMRVFDTKPPSELHSIPSPSVEIVAKSPFEPPTKYKINYLTEPIPSEEIGHFKYFNPIYSTENASKRHYGQSPLMACRRLMGKYSDADITQGSMFKNQGPAGLLTGDKDNEINEEQARAVQDRFKMFHSGTARAGDIIVTPAKLSWTQIGLSPVDLNIKEGKEEILSELCNAYHAPIGMFSSANSTENNMIESRKMFITDAVIPLVESRKNVLNRWLCPMFGDDIKIEFDYTVFHELQEDLEKLAKTYKFMDWVTDNERRAATNFDRYDDPAADKLYKNPNLVPIEDLSLGIEPIDETQLDAETNQ